MGLFDTTSCGLHLGGRKLSEMLLSHTGFGGEKHRRKPSQTLQRMYMLTWEVFLAALVASCLRGAFPRFRVTNVSP